VSTKCLLGLGLDLDSDSDLDLDLRVVDLASGGLVTSLFHLNDRLGWTADNALD